MGNRSVDILARVQSARAKDYVREFNTTLAPCWRRESAVGDFIQRTRIEAVRQPLRGRQSGDGGDTHELAFRCAAPRSTASHRSSLDAGRVRDIIVAVSPSHAAAILAARENSATESDLHDAVAEAIADAYFRQGGGGRAGLEVKFADVEWLDIRF
ncbi:hypothetical protein OG949_40335 (plasmid) [Streptomyces scopuliridis]|uniref:hypothetical protein n=1 Tax=Streptomyces scopuliridis TaxID=452529 RepID=UPI002DDBDF0A|nr:hypothetical protein [Streptomyces scopuliridis]WSB39008.1 hypothetical protein OG949_40335 [Streptomyces scopuliridis]